MSVARAHGNSTNRCTLGDVYNDFFICSAETADKCYYIHQYCIPHSPFLLQLPVVLFLLGMGADWRMVDKDGDTLLHFACMKEVESGMHDNTLEYLLYTPAFATLRNSQNVRGDTPLMVATRCGLVLYFC